ncbi:hypothetical protein QQ045_000742 [Rhodiola kirilowii]
MHNQRRNLHHPLPIHLQVKNQQRERGHSQRNYKPASFAQTAPNSPKPKPIFKPKSSVTISPPLAETRAQATVSASEELAEPTTVAYLKVSKDTVIEDTLLVTRAKLKQINNRNWNISYYNYPDLL